MVPCGIEHRLFDRPAAALWPAAERSVRQAATEDLGVSQRNLTEVLLAVAGVYLIVARLPEVGIGIALLASHDHSSGSIDNSTLASLSLVAPVLSASAGALLVLLRKRLARLLIPALPSPESPFSTRELQAALFAVVGVYIGLQGAARLIGGWIASGAARQSAISVWPSYAGALFQVVAGIALFFGARGLAGAWALARLAGHDRSAREDPV